jgi:serine/threonine protein kinase
MICVQDVLNQMNLQHLEENDGLRRVPDLQPASERGLLIERYTRRLPREDLFPFIFSFQIHVTYAFQFRKVTDRETNRDFCLKQFDSEANQIPFGSVEKCVTKLLELRNGHFEGFYGLVQDYASRNFLVHDYYRFTIETIILVQVSLTLADWKLIMSQMLASIYYLMNMGYFYPNLKLSSFLLSELNSVKLGGLYHVIASSSFTKFDPKYLDYCPPEFVLGDRNHREGYAIWNLGCLFVEIFSSGGKIFGTHQTNAMQHVNAILAMNHDTNLATDPIFWNYLPLYRLIRPVPGIWTKEDPLQPLPDDAQLRQLVRAMLSVDVHQRWTLRQCLIHTSSWAQPAETSGLGQLRECPSIYYSNPHSD